MHCQAVFVWPKISVGSLECEDPFISRQDCIQEVFQRSMFQRGMFQPCSDDSGTVCQRSTGDRSQLLTHGDGETRSGEGVRGDGYRGDVSVSRDEH